MTGATGFIGTHLLAAAGAAGIEALGAARNPPEGALECDLGNEASIRACVAQAAPDLVVNAAGNPSVAASWSDPDAVRETNAIGVERLLRAVAAEAPGAHVLCLSSAQVYGRAAEGDRAFAEDDPLEPVTPYGSSKAEMEAIAARVASERGLTVAVARLFNQIGPGQSPSQATAEFARDIAAAEGSGAESVTLTVDHPGSARDFTDVRDAAVALLAISTRRLSGPFNVCSGKAVSLAEVVESLAELTSLEVSLEAGGGESRPEGATRSHGDPSRLRDRTGWEPTIPLSRSLSDLLESWRK